MQDLQKFTSQQKKKKKNDLQKFTSLVERDFRKNIKMYRRICTSKDVVVLAVHDLIYQNMESLSEVASSGKSRARLLDSLSFLPLVIIYFVALLHFF